MWTTPPAFRSDGKVDAATISDRRNRLMALQKKISRQKLRAWKGRVETALIEGPSVDNPLVWEARLEGMAPDIDGKLYLTNIEVPGPTPTSPPISAQPGDVARIEISKTDAYDLIARVVEILPRPALRTLPPAAAAPPPQALTRIATGAPLRVLG